MKRKSLVFAVLAAAVSAAVVAAVSFAAGGGKPASGITFHLVEKSQSFHYVDNPPIGARNEPPTQGDMFVLTSNLFTTSGKRAGTLYADCILAAGGKNSIAECTGTFALAGGQLSGTTLIHLNNQARTNIAIVGGTGAYEGARGSVVSVSSASGNISHDTIHLLTS